ncbi:hypothetical protein Poly30_27030 [Planctomycetes bacterium Poly30]|uniref:Uncharacterized protein n=2 Tax=Saltatorellus ferox TaxID=2528018 RepID=A0A518ESW7_9BACT|nr:hypothetical protein Poly30_27030 [Planctomycetes bacterium Poly30]
MARLSTFSSFLLSALVSVVWAGPGSSFPDVAVNWRLPERAPYAGEAIPVTLEITLPAAWESGNLLQLYPKPLDLPLQVGGFDALASGRFLAVPEFEGAPDPASRTVVVDGEVDHAQGPLLTEGPSGRLATYTIRHWFRAPRSGVIELPAPTAHYAVATEFREDFVQGRVPVDRRTADAVGSSAELQILELPEEGRPFEFAGAVGRFELKATTPAPTASAGETVDLRVTVRSLGRSPAHDVDPRSIKLASSDAFTEQGRTVDADDSNGAQVVTISLLARSPSVDALPTASLAYFDPSGEPPGYALAMAAPPTLRVVQGSAPPSDETAAMADGSDVLDPEPRSIPYWTIGVLSLVFALAVASVIRRHLAFGEARADASSRDA